jgi:hypothetical protein
MSEATMKEWIDNASLEDLLRKWRFAPSGDPFFQEEVGDHYWRVMQAKREADPREWTRVSKKVGWQ